MSFQAYLDTIKTKTGKDRRNCRRWLTARAFPRAAS